MVAPFGAFLMQNCGRGATEVDLKFSVRRINAQKGQMPSIVNLIISAGGKLAAAPLNRLGDLWLLKAAKPNFIRLWSRLTADLFGGIKLRFQPKQQRI